MNKRTFKRIQRMYEDGISLQSAILAIIDICENTPEAAIRVIEFYREILPLGTRPDSKYIAAWSVYKGKYKEESNATKT